jgi:hypothetical protein
VSFIFIDNKTSVEVDIPEQTQVIKGNRFVSLKKNIADGELKLLSRNQMQDRRMDKHMFRHG